MKSVREEEKEECESMRKGGREEGRGKGRV